MYKKLVTLIFMTSMFAVPAYSQQTVDTYALSRLPVLSRTIPIPDVVSPFDLPTGAQTKDVPCLNGSRTVNAQMPWVWCYDYNSPTAFVRPHISLTGYPDDASWQLLIKDEGGAEIDRLHASLLTWKAQGQGDPLFAERWTERVPGRKLQIELHATAPPRNLRITVDRVNVSFFRPGRKAITTGSNDMRDLLAAVKRNHVHYDYSRSIAHIHLLMSDRSNRETNCTGFLLTRELLMTNQHCISEDWQLENAKATFGFESQPPAPTAQDVIPFVKIEMQDPDLDFAILRLKWPVRDAWRPATIDSRPIAKDQKLLLIQHPNDQPKVLSLVDCTVQSITVEDLPRYKNDFYHLCDCEGGSSGAPVFDLKTGRVVGLHHREIEKIFDDGVNLGVRMSEILAKIDRDNKPLYNLIRNSIQ